MRNIETSFIRLMMLAEHLGGDTLFEKYEGLHFFYSDDKKTLLIGRSGKYHCLFPEATCEMPHLFQEFEKRKDNNIIYNPAPDISVYFGMQEFFGLELNEFLHLFAVGGQQPAKFNGKILSIDYKVQEVAANIYEYLQTVLDSQDINSKIPNEEI